MLDAFLQWVKLYSLKLYCTWNRPSLSLIRVSCKRELLALSLDQCCMYVYGFGFGVSVSRLDSWTAFESPKAIEDPRFWTGPNSKQKTANLEMQRTRFRRTGTRGLNKFLGQKKWEIISQKFETIETRTWGSLEKFESDNTGLDHALVTAFSYLEFV